MSVSEILNLPLKEKFHIMELLWDDMRGEIDAAEVPQEHRELLDSRRARIERGEARLLDWDRVKNKFVRK